MVVCVHNWTLAHLCHRVPSRLADGPFLKRSGVLFAQATMGADAFQDGGERGGFCTACHQ